MILSQRQILSQKLDALVGIARQEGWCPDGTRLAATPNREFQETGVYTDDTTRILSLRCGTNHVPDGSSVQLADRRVGWDDDTPFLFVMAAVLALDGHAYHAQVSLPSGLSPVFDEPNLSSAHERIATTARLMGHLATLGWTPGMWLGNPYLLDAASQAIADALPPCR